ncbi:MAG: metallophosphoesterase [Bacteroidales bacterium]|nr:metallophosphoesterase [Bacteroidales bacterium]
MKNYRLRILPLAIISISLLFISSCKTQHQEAAGGEDTFSFAFLTDTHLQPGKNAAEGFRQAIDTVNMLKPDFVITGGDQIMDALGQTESRTDSLYDMYVEMAELFDMPVYNTMGNHEVFGIYEQSGVDETHPLYGEKMYEERIGERYYAFNHKGWRFYILDSVDEREDGSGYYGHVDSLQIAWLKEDLANVDPSTPIAISVHIPFITIQTQLVNGSTAPNSEGLVITNARDVLLLFQEHNLRLVLQGHLHFLEDLYAGGVHFITGGAVSSSWWNGPRGDLQEGFLLVHLNGEDLDWEYVDYGWDVAVN